MQIERQLQGTLNTILTELIKEKGLENRIMPYPALEENRADITLKSKSGKTLFFIELKDPTAKDGKSVFDSTVLLRELRRAQTHDINYFSICNFLGAAFFDAKNINLDKAIVFDGPFSIQEITRLSVNYAPSKDNENKLRLIADFYLARAIEILERKSIKFAELDELFIFKIRKLIEVHAHPITDKVWEKYKHNKTFEKEIQRYAQSQLWNKPATYEEMEKLTYIGILMLISKLIFYKAYVDNQTWHALHPMKIPNSIATPEELEELIWNYFETFKEVTNNFDSLIGERSDIIFKIPFVSETVVDLVKEILDTEQSYDFSKIPFDIIGRIFEELIREDERHKLGQYFTPPHVIDLINAFAIHKSNDKVFDPSCGSGTFLVRAYERKKLLCEDENKGIKHEKLLDEIYGNDLSGYPAYLSMLNLAIRNMRKASYPRIINKDFFSIYRDSKIKLHNQNGEEEKKSLPQFDAIIGNPPYTRQEDIGTMHGTVGKSEIQTLINAECSFQPSQRTSIYAYFFYHASVFLKEGGYLAFIVQNSWLDTDYGIDMQRYLMRNYEIVAIMDSEVERFFPSASVNTSIVILRKQKDEKARNKNIVKFIYFTSTLADAIKKHKGVNKLSDIINATNKNEDNINYRLNCVQQQTLSKFTKWGQFLKAPKVYFDIMEKGLNKFKPLSQSVKIKRGITTGCNEYFILEDKTETAIDDLLKATVNNNKNIQNVKQLKANGLKLMCNGFNEMLILESDCLEPILTSPKDVNTYIINSKKVPSKFLLTHETKKNVRNETPYLYSYIRHGEKMNIHLRSTCKSRKIWYDLGEREKPSLSFSYMINDFGKTYFGKIFSNDNFQNIYAKKNIKSIFLYMNSTVSWLIQQLMIRTNFGDGVGKIQSYELADMPFISVDLEKSNIELGETKNYKEELGTLESLKTVNPERVKLDSAILETIGYKNKKEREEVLLELYKATYKLINARLQKAQILKGVKKQRNKVEFRVYVEQLKELLLEGKYEAKNTLKFVKELEKLVKEISSENRLQKKILDSYWKEKFGISFNEKNIAEQEQEKLF